MIRDLVDVTELEREMYTAKDLTERERRMLAALQYMLEREESGAFALGAEVLDVLRDFVERFDEDAIENLRISYHAASRALRKYEV